MVADTKEIGAAQQQDDAQTPNQMHKEKLERNLPLVKEPSFPYKTYYSQLLNPNDQRHDNPSIPQCARRSAKECLLCKRSYRYMG